MGHALNVLCLAGIAAGDPAATEYGWRALAAFEGVGVLQLQGEVLNNLADAAGRAGRWDEAVELFGRSRQALEQAGDVLSVAVVEGNLAEILSDQGRFEEARPLAESALETCRAARHQVTAFAEEILGRLLSRTGHGDEAAQLLADAEERYDALGVSDQVAKVEALQAERLLYAGEFAAVIEATERLFESSAPGVRPLVHRVRGAALAASGEFGDARGTLLEGLALARSLGNTFECALLLGTLAWCAIEGSHLEEARAYEAESKDLLAQLGVRQLPGPQFV